MASYFDGSKNIQKSKQVHWKSVNGEVVLMHFQSGDYFALDAVGSFLWTKICQETVSITELKDSLISEYECTEAEADADVSNLCEQLVAEQLVELV